MSTTNFTMNNQITTLIDSIISQVESTQAAESYCESWHQDALVHFYNLELSNLYLPSNLQIDISAEFCRLRIQAHDMQTEVLNMQARVKAARHQLRDLLRANGDEGKLIDDIDAEGWVPNIGILRQRLTTEMKVAAEEESAASTPPSLVSCSTTSSSSSSSSSDIDEAQDNYGYPFPVILTSEPCIFNQHSSEDENLTPSQITALLRLWGCDGEKEIGLHNARLDEYVRTEQMCLGDWEGRIYDWMTAMDGLVC